MNKLFTLFVALLLTITVTAQTTLDKSMLYGGLNRTYRIYIPANYTPTKAVPLVLNLHGYSSNNLQQEFYGDFRPIADTAGFIIVLPNGTNDGSGNLFWNVGFAPSPIDDVGFLNTLVDTISANYTINQARIYSTGMSNGGFMSYELACQSPKFAAIASVTGSITTGSYAQCAPSRPVPVMEIHGTADGTVPYLGTTLFRPIDTVLAYWVHHNQCNPTPTMNNVTNSNLTDGATAEHYVWSGGLNNTTVEHYKIISGAHTWPGAGIVIGVTCMDFSASKEIWRFFNQYSLTTAIAHPNFHADIQISPNPAHDFLTLRREDIASDAIVSIIDMQGKTCKTFTLTESNQTIDIQDLAKGFYFLSIYSSKGNYTQKWVKY